MNIVKDDLSQETLGSISQFKNDYFFHFLLINNDIVRLFLCKYISQDDSITYTTIENSETFHPYYQGKKLILDVVCKDDKGRYYDFEIHNYDIETEDQIRMIRYSERLVIKQEYKGMDLETINQVFQLIIYTGKPVENLEYYRHDIRKADEQKNISFQGDKVKTVLLQLKKMKEEYDMELALQPMEQLGYLFLNDKVHENSETDEIVEEVIDMHDMYVNSDAFWDAYEYETERKVFRAKEKRAEEKGKEEGMLNGKRETLIMQLTDKFGSISNNLTEQINQANLEQLNLMLKHIFTMNTEEDVLHILQSIWK